jgi:hypothetical protein
MKCLYESDFSHNQQARIFCLNFIASREKHSVSNFEVTVELLNTIFNFIYYEHIEHIAHILYDYMIIDIEYFNIFPILKGFVSLFDYDSFSARYYTYLVDYKFVNCCDTL